MSMDHPGGFAVAPACAFQRVVKVVANHQVAHETFQLTVDDPAMAASMLPGQFLMVRPPGGSDPLLGRPFALYEVERDDKGVPTGISVVYTVVGKGTSALSRCRQGDELSIWGPLGHPFGLPPIEGEVLFVAGGIGQTPFLALGRWWLGRSEYGGIQVQQPARSATLLYGIRSAEMAAGLSDFKAAGINVELATDDGSIGHHGYVTDLLRARLARNERPAKVVGCGPPAMLAALSKLVAEYDVPCDLSLENHMACGFGVCFSCVAPIRQSDGSTDLKRVCVEGPIFAAHDVVWS